MVVSALQLINNEWKIKPIDQGFAGGLDTAMIKYGLV